MTSFRQIEANRRNALKSTGPTTPEGKDRSRRNAVRHGLSAETVITALEDVDDYRAFEAAVIADYDARTAVERELVLRLASLLWRLRRATSIETALMSIQAGIARDRNEVAIIRNRNIGAEAFCPNLENNGPDQRYIATEDATLDPDGFPTISHETMARGLGLSFQRLANFDSGAFDRLGRYESRLWRQTVQILFFLKSAKCF
jgi:hypothetical protein